MTSLFVVLNVIYAKRRAGARGRLARGDRADQRATMPSATLRAGLNDRAAVLARLSLAPTFAHPWVVGALQHLETLTSWTWLVLPV